MSDALHKIPETSDEGMPHESLVAISTYYGGHLFRSRLEARWAHFFDLLMVEYAYEEEGFQLGEARYLPDFYIPSWNMYVEVKNIQGPKGEELFSKPLALARASRRGVLVVFGDPMDKKSVVITPQGMRLRASQMMHCPRCLSFHLLLRDWGSINISKHKARTADSLIRSDIKRPQYINLSVTKRAPKHTPSRDLHKQKCLVCRVPVKFDPTLIASAAWQARKARFEFGQTPGAC